MELSLGDKTTSCNYLNPKFDLYLSYVDLKISVDPPKVIAATKEVSSI